MEPVSEIYVVGSDEEKFVCDRVYLDRGAAVAYSDERAVQGGSWLVMMAPVGGDWSDWEVVHRSRG